MMHDMNLLAAVGLVGCWGAFALAWLAGAIYYESQAPAERTRNRYASPLWISTPIVVAVAVAVPRADWRPLTFYAPPVRLLGLVILLVGTAFAIWARLALGAMWSAAPTVKEEHKLRISGPYAITRHPIYTGLLGMFLGSLLLAGAGRWIVAFPFYLVLLQFKIRAEERLMLAEFPGDYPRYRRRVPRLVPGLRLISGHTHASRQAPAPAILVVFAVWGLSGFGYPSAPLPYALNVLSKILAFATALSLFWPQRAQARSPRPVPGPATTLMRAGHRSA